jgi:hypothetical protein
MLSRRVALIAFVVTIGLLGCGGQNAPKEDGVFTRRAEQAAAPPALDKKPAAEAPPAGGDKAADAATPAPERKIIFTAHLDVVVKDLNEAWAATEKLLAEHKGYVAKSEVRSDSGARRTGTYTLRVPVDRYAGLVGKLKELGTPERDATDSQDVTDEFYDTQARIKNLKEREAKLNDLLREKRKEEKVEDIMKISDRVDDVRRDIDRAEGQLKRLSALSALSTVNLTLKEIKDYKPPTAPTFGERVGRTLGGSWDALVTFGEGAALTVVALTPWLPLIIPAVVVGIVLIRRARRQYAEYTRVHVVSHPTRRRAERPGPTSEDVPPPAE